MRSGPTTALLTDTWTYNNPATTLSDGTYFFTAMATDPTGYSTPLSYPYEVTIDTHVPTAPVLNDITPDTGLSSTDGITDVNTPTFSGWSEPFDVINLYDKAAVNGGPIGNSSFIGTHAGQISSGRLVVRRPRSADWGDGTYNVTATAMDIAGTTSAASSTLTIVIDTQPPPSPVVTGISPDTGKSNDGITTAQNLIISGTAQAGTSVSIILNGGLLGTTMAGTNGAWTFDNTAMTLPDGNYAITAEATDVAGNVSPFVRLQRDDRDGQVAGHRRGEPDHRSCPGARQEPAVAVGHRDRPGQ